MKIELSQKEVELLDQALQSWEREEAANSMMGTMFTALIVKDEEKAREISERHCAEAKKRSDIRKSQSLLLRAKLAQASTIDSEHTIA